MHFEDLWEQCENLHGEITEDTQSILHEITLKLNLLTAIESKLDSSNDEQQKIKAHTFGELLFSFTKLSSKEGINVFEALSYALHNRSIEHYSKLYEDRG